MRQLKTKDVKKLRKYLLEKQGGKCLICKKEPKQPVLDDSHTKRIKGSGRIRGVLCSTCNVFLAKVENNSVRYLISQEELSTILLSMAEYLKKEHLPYIHPSEAPKKPKLTKSSYSKLKKALDKINRKCPEYSKSSILTKLLEKEFKKVDIEPQFYKK